VYIKFKTDLLMGILPNYYLSGISPCFLNQTIKKQKTKRGCEYQNKMLDVL